MEVEMRRQLGLAIVLGALVISGAYAQESKRSRQPFKGSTPAEQLREAYEKTRTLSSAQELNEVIEVCERALATKLGPEDAKYGRDLLSWAFNRRGEFHAEQAGAYIERGQTQKAAEMDALALRDFESSVEYDPTRYKALHNRGVSFALQGKSREAIADFDRVIELKPDYVNAWFNRAELQLEVRQFAAAVDDYSESLRLKPDDVPAYVGRAKALLQLGKAKDALADADRATQLDTEHALARAVHGEASVRLHKWEEAANDFQTAIKLDNQCAAAYLGAAWLMATCPDNRYRNAPLAVQAAEKALKLGGENPHALDVLAAAQANAGQYEEAQQTIARALELAPQDQASDLTRRHDLYVSGKPFRLPAKLAVKSGSVLR
jgi:tetratricopeptide (TPR) repeat protein